MADYSFSHLIKVAQEGLSYHYVRKVKCTLDLLTHHPWKCILKVFQEFVISSVQILYPFNSNCSCVSGSQDLNIIPSYGILRYPKVGFWYQEYIHLYLCFYIIRNSGQMNLGSFGNVWGIVICQSPARDSGSMVLIFHIWMSMVSGNYK